MGIEDLVNNLSSVSHLGFTVIEFHLEFGCIEKIQILTSKKELSVQPNISKNYVKCLENILFRKGVYLTNVRTDAYSAPNYKAIIRFSGELYKEVKNIKFSSSI